MSVHSLYSNDHRTVYQHKGGTKFLTSAGIEVTVHTGFGDNPDGEVHFAPITSKGRPSEQARIVVHAHLLESLIQVLQHARTELAARPYITGDGQKFASLVQARRHADNVMATTGNVISIEGDA